MDNTKEQPDQKTFSYPNADRPAGDTSPTTGPNPIAHPIVHIEEAIQGQKNNETNSTPTIHTFQSDVANAIHTDNVSMIKVALAEKNRKDKQGTFDDTANIPKQNKTLIAAILVIIALGIIAGGVWFAWSYFNSSSANNTGQNSSNTNLTAHSPIEFEQTVLLNIDGKYASDIEEAVRTEKNSELPFGTMKQIVFTKNISDGTISNSLNATSENKVRPASLAEWLSAIRSRASDSLIRSLDPSFVFGIYSYTPHDSFILLKVNSYDNTYAGMLDWEQSIETDLQGELINPLPSSIIPGAGTTTPAVTRGPLLNGKPFIDRVINNKDARVLLDDSGNIRLLYSFIDQNTLVITSSDKALKEIIVRMTTGRIVR